MVTRWIYAKWYCRILLCIIYCHWFISRGRINWYFSRRNKGSTKNIVKAVNGVIWRILIFYLGAIFVIVSVYPWDELGNIGSPFVATFAKVGITFAAGLINFVVLTAAMSGCNSGIFSASRMIYTLARKGQLPKIFTKVMKNGVPLYTVLAISTGILIGALLNVILPMFIKGADSIFVYVYSASILPGMIPWFMILFSHIRFRKLHPEETKTIHSKCLVVWWQVT